MCTSAKKLKQGKIIMCNNSHPSFYKYGRLHSKSDDLKIVMQKLINLQD